MARPRHHRKRRRYRRRNDPSPSYRLKRRYHTRHRRNDPDPRRRRRHYRHHRYNPPPAATLATDVLYAGIGFIGTKFIGNMTAPMFGVYGQPIVRIGIKTGLAWISAWVISEWMTGKRTFTPIFLGGMAEVLGDTVKTFIAPMVPALSAYTEPIPTLGEYYAAAGALAPPAQRGGAMGSYYGGIGDPDDVREDVAI